MLHFPYITKFYWNDLMHNDHPKANLGSTLVSTICQIIYNKYVVYYNITLVSSQSQ